MSDDREEHTLVETAIAEQEEHIKRVTSCCGQVGRLHFFRAHGRPGPNGSISGSTMYSACITCGVTESRKDYYIALEGR